MASMCKDPYLPTVTVVPFLWTIPYMRSILTDTHFGNLEAPQMVLKKLMCLIIAARDRMGRMITFLTRVMTDSVLHPTQINYLYGVGELLAYETSPCYSVLTVNLIV
jgi:hypothetical protein